MKFLEFTNEMSLHRRRGRQEIGSRVRLFSTLNHFCEQFRCNGAAFVHPRNDTLRRVYTSGHLRSTTNMVKFVQSFLRNQEEERFQNQVDKNDDEESGRALLFSRFEVMGSAYTWDYCVLIRSDEWHIAGWTGVITYWLRELDALVEQVSVVNSSPLLTRTRKFPRPLSPKSILDSELEPPDTEKVVSLDSKSNLSVKVVTRASQLPTEFLEPSCDKPLVIGLYCEGVNLCRHGAVCILQLAFPDAIYLVDVIEGGKELVKACKPSLESEYITKVVHDCKRHSEALFFQYGIKLHNVMDTQIAYYLIKEQDGHAGTFDDYISFVGLLAELGFRGSSYVEKEEVRALLMQDPKFWTYRPLSELMVRAAADDVHFHLEVYSTLMARLNQRSRWYLAVRGSLYCRCFCISENNYADWPPLPSVPDGIDNDGIVPEEDMLSVLDVPVGKMGCITGKGGSCVLSVKESCKAEIFIEGEKGPPNKVFIIGPVSQVLKAEEMLRRRLQRY